MKRVSLSGLNGNYEISKSLREKMVLLSDGSIIVNENYKHDPDVLNKITLFCNMILEDGAVLAKRSLVTYDTPNKIREFYAEESSVSFSDNASQIQREIVDLINLAHQKRASDIHIELNAPSTFVMFRILGDLVMIKTWTYDEGNAICTTLYNTMTSSSGTNFNSRNQQDANMQATFLPDDLAGIRVATGPTQGGNYFMVLRLLPKGANSKLEDLGYDKFQLALIRQCMATHSGGITIFSGPTGSGKSSSLQALNKEVLLSYKGRINLISIEDPIEYPISVSEEIDGRLFTYSARQVTIPSTQDKELRKGYFNNAVVASMRQDPDVLMIGEIRDEVSASAALTASITGHPVVTTVHASSALMNIERLITIGANKKLLLAPGSISGLISQHLVPVMCPNCRVSIIDNLSLFAQKYPDLLTRLGAAFNNNLTNIYISGEGCDYVDPITKNTCINGSIARTVVAEVLVPDEEFLQYAKADDLYNANKYWIENLGGVTMMAHGLAKVKRGLVDPLKLEAKLKLITPQANVDLCDIVNI